MSKVLITGATSSQCSEAAQKRSTRFAGLLSTAINSSGDQSFIAPPTVLVTPRDIEQYDSVIVGLAPMSSLSSNHIYGALYTLGLALDAGNGKILFDAPDPQSVFKSFKSVIANPSLLVKEIYAPRSGYNEVVHDDKVRNKIIETIELISNEGVPTIIPSVPYFQATRKDYGIPDSTIHSDLITLNFDLMRVPKTGISLDSAKCWSSESINSKWSKTIEKTLSKTVLPLKRSAYDSEFEYVDRLRNSIGFLLNTHRNDLPWWSPNILLALSNGVPVFSDWRHTGILGDCWGDLPSNSEMYSPNERLSLSLMQLDSYQQNIPNWEENLKISVSTTTQ